MRAREVRWMRVCVGLTGDKERVSWCPEHGKCPTERGNHRQFLGFCCLGMLTCWWQRILFVLPEKPEILIIQVKYPDF